MIETHVLVVVLFAAALHATWNALVKGAPDKLISMTAVVLGHAPFALLAFPFVPLPVVVFGSLRDELSSRDNDHVHDGVDVEVYVKDDDRGLADGREHGIDEHLGRAR